jgi:hypothetical protein
MEQFDGEVPLLPEDRHHPAGLNAFDEEEQPKALRRGAAEGSYEEEQPKALTKC